MGKEQSKLQTNSYEVKNDYRLYMIGDSILDNAYWNGVNENTTAEYLRKMMPKVEVVDRTTEELDAMTLHNNLVLGRTF